MPRITVTAYGLPITGVRPKHPGPTIRGSGEEPLDPEGARWLERETYKAARDKATAILAGHGLTKTGRTPAKPRDYSECHIHKPAKLAKPVGLPMAQRKPKGARLWSTDKSVYW